MLGQTNCNNNNTVTTTSSFQNGITSFKRKRRPAGTPDPDAEVVALSPKTLLESERYVCEICNQGFQRGQNLQMHRRRHKVPWKLVRREDTNNGSGRGGGDNQETKKRVYVCPEPTCLHHDPCHALGDLVGIKKHFRRKHSNYKQWVCDKCFKGYAVQSDYKAHLKTCGTRGHSCDCGRVFSRAESFIDHQDSCTIKRVNPNQYQKLPAAFQPAARSFSTSLSGCDETANLAMSHFQRAIPVQEPTHHPAHHNLELQLLSSSSNRMTSLDNRNKNEASNLNPSIGLFDRQTRRGRQEDASLTVRVAEDEKEYAEEMRRTPKREMQLAESEFENAKKIRQQALGRPCCQENKLNHEAHHLPSMSTTISSKCCSNCTNLGATI